MGYSLASERTQANTNAVIGELTAAASGEVALISVGSASGESGANAGTRVHIARLTGGATPVAQTPEKLHDQAAAAASSGAVQYTTAPTVSNILLSVGTARTSSGTNNHVRRWRAHPRYPITASASARVGLAHTTGGTAALFARGVTFVEPQSTPQRAIRGRRGRTRGYWLHGQHMAGTWPASVIGVPRPGSFVMVQAETWQMSPPYRPMSAALFEALFGGGTDFPVAVAGAIASSGALLKDVGLPRSGAITPAGALLKLLARALAGSASSSGLLLKDVGKALAGSISSSGSLATLRSLNVAISGAIASSGALVRAVGKPLAGGVTPAAIVVKSIARTLSAGVTPAGALSSLRSLNIALAGAIASTGSLRRGLARSLSGSVSGAGALGRALARRLAGAVVGAGLVRRGLARTLTGGLTSSSSLVSALATGLLELVASVSATLGFGGSASPSDSTSASLEATGPSGSTSPTDGTIGGVS